jgi:hypothetical protein
MSSNQAAITSTPSRTNQARTVDKVIVEDGRVSLSTILTGADDFTLWQGLLRVNLSARGLWEIIVDEKQQPLDAKTIFAQVPDDQKVAWMQRNAKALAAIVNNIASPLQIEIINEEYAADAYNILLQHFGATKKVSRLSLLRKIFSLKALPTASIEEHLQAFTKLQSSLASIYPNLDDELLSVALINSLPDTPEWLNFTQILTNTQEKFSTKDVLSRIRNQMLYKTDSSSAASQSGSQQMMVVSSAPRENRCPIHKHGNHSAQECRQLNKKPKNQTRKKFHKPKQKPQFLAMFDAVASDDVPLDDPGEQHLPVFDLRTVPDIDEEEEIYTFQMTTWTIPRSTHTFQQAIKRRSNAVPPCLQIPPSVIAGSRTPVPVSISPTMLRGYKTSRTHLQ